MMHGVSEVEIDAIVRPTVFFPHTDKFEIPYLTKNLQDNFGMPPERHHIYGRHPDILAVLTYGRHFGRPG